MTVVFLAPSDPAPSGQSLPQRFHLGLAVLPAFRPLRKRMLTPRWSCGRRRPLLRCIQGPVENLHVHFGIMGLPAGVFHHLNKRQPRPPRHGENTHHLDTSGLLVGKSHFLAHRDIRPDRPLQDEDHVTMARHARPLRQVIQSLDRFRRQLHSNCPRFSLCFHEDGITSTNFTADASIRHACAPRADRILRLYHAPWMCPANWTP